MPDFTVALPWYNFAQTRPLLDRVWERVVVELRRVGVNSLPSALDHSTPHQQLLRIPELSLSQCCGPDLFQSPGLKVQPIAAPVISAYEVAPGDYYSYIAARDGADVQRPRVAVNSYTSYSGCIAIKQWLLDHGIGEYKLEETGSHAQSVLALQQGRADLAAIDALSWCFIDTWGLKVLDRSKPVLAPPFVVGATTRIAPEHLVPALDIAFAAVGKELGIVGALPVSRADYQHHATAVGVTPPSAR